MSSVAPTSAEEAMAIAQVATTSKVGGSMKSKPIMYKKKSTTTVGALMTSGSAGVTYLEPESDIFSSFIGSDIASKPGISGQTKVHYEIICSVTTKDAKEMETVYKWSVWKTFTELSQFHEEVINKFFPTILFPPKTLMSIQMSERAIRNRRAALESYWKEMSRSVGATISNRRYFNSFNKFLRITDSMISINIQDRIQISELILQQKARIVEDSTCVSDILNLFPTEHVVLKELRAECDKLADELDTISKERARAERKYNAMMGTKQTSLNRVDELKRSIEEAKAAVASFDLLSQAAEAEIRAVREREAFLEGELLTAQSHRDESQQAYSQLKETLKEISSSQLSPEKESEDKGERAADANVAENEHKQEEEEFSEDAEVDESAVPDDENTDKTTPSEAHAELRDQSDRHKGENVTSDCEGSDMDTTAASTPERSAMTSSSTNSNSDEMLLTAGNSATGDIKRLSESAPHPSSSSQTSLSAIQKETQAASDDERQTSRETVETDGTRSQNGHGTTSVDSQRKASGNSSRSASASSLAPPPKPAKPRSKPPDKLSIPLGSSSRFGYGGRTESESEFVEISL